MYSWHWWPMPKVELLGWWISGLWFGGVCGSPTKTPGRSPSMSLTLCCWRTCLWIWNSKYSISLWISIPSKVPLLPQHGSCWAVICYPFITQKPGSFLSSLYKFSWFNSAPPHGCYLVENNSGSIPDFLEIFLLLFPVCQCLSCLTSEVNISGNVLLLNFQINATPSVKQLTLLPISPCWWCALSSWSPQPGACVETSHCMGSIPTLTPGPSCWWAMMTGPHLPGTVRQRCQLSCIPTTCYSNEDIGIQEHIFIMWSKCQNGGKMSYAHE